MMKHVFGVLLTLCLTVIQAQSLETRIQGVELGLSFPKITSPNQPLKTKDIITRLNDFNIPGASVAVLHNGKIDWSKAYGITDVSNPDQVTTETLFQCASVGKIITALSILKLVDEGKIALDENVNNKLKRWKIGDNKFTAEQVVTLRHLLSHSSGLADEYGFLGYAPDREIPDVLEILNNGPKSNAKKSLSVKNIPGKQENYSGGGYLIVQLLIEDLSGKTFAEYVQDNIFNVLAMTHTTYSHKPDEQLGFKVARGHKGNGKVFKNKKYHIYPEKAAAGPWTTAEDLAKIALAIQGNLKNESNSLLSRELISEFITPQINRRGLGVHLRGVNRPLAIWHAGQNLGYTGLFYALTEKGDGAIILVNSEGGEIMIQEFISSVANEYQWPIMKSYQALEEFEEKKSALVGTYEDSSKLKRFSIELLNDQLFVKIPNSKKGEALYKINENHYTFKDAQDYYKLSFNHKSNKIISVSYTESIGKTVELEKVN
ncbi:MAG: serine hydrolase domain-containing protein [Bacteroidota bacterium]